MSDSTEVTLPLGGDDYFLPSILDDTVATLLFRSKTVDKESHLKKTESISREWEVGDLILDLYEVLEILGAGAFGKVYKVLHIGWNILLAVKTLRFELEENIDLRESFKKECEGWVNLGLHPNIVSCYYVRDLGGLPRIFLEYIKGGTLRDRMKKELELNEILDFSIQCLDGLSFAHKKKLIHRDIKPANCMITSKGALKITDFGIAAGLENLRVEKHFDEKFINTEGASGTPAYMPPEQWGKDYGTIGPGSDLYSLGVMLFEMCCKKRPFDTGVEHTGVIKLRHLNESPPIPHEIDKKIPENLSSFILKCLNKKIKDRFLTCEEARDELVKIYRSITGKDYDRKKPEEASLLADGLNNRAVSLMDLGFETSALKIWEEALKADFLHLPSTFNSSLVKWRRGKINDLDVIEKLDNILSERPERVEVNYFLGLIHLERGDHKKAIEKLNSALQCSRGKDDIKRALEVATKRLSSSTGFIKEIKLERNEEPESISLNSEGTIAFISCRTKVKKDIMKKQTADTGNYYLLDIEKGEFIKKRFCHPFWLSAISRDGTRAISGGGKDYSNLWDLKTASLVKSYPTGPQGRLSLSISPSSKYFADGGKDGVINIYDNKTGGCVRKLSGHTGPVSILCFINEEKELLSGSVEGEWTFSGVNKGKARLNIWDINTGKIIRSFETEEEVESATFSKDGKTGVTIRENELKIWDTEKNECLHTCFIERKQASSKDISISKDGSIAMTDAGSAGPNEYRFHLWDTENGCCKRTISTIGGNNCTLSEDGKTALFWQKSWIVSFIHIWKINRENLSSFYSPLSLSSIRQTEEIIKSQSRFSELIEEAEKNLEEKNWNRAIDILSEARNLPGYEVNQKILDLWQKLYRNCRKIGIKSVKKSKTLGIEKKTINSLFISNDKKTLITSSMDGSIKIWDLIKEKCIKTIKSQGKNREVLSLTISNDNKFIVSGHFDGSVNLWTIDGKLVREHKGHTKMVRTVSVSRDSKWILSGSDDKTIKLWDFSSSRCLRTFTGHKKEIYTVKFSYDNQEIYSNESDSIKIWDVAECKCINTINKTGSTIYFDSTSSRALSGGLYDLHLNNKTCMRLWDLSTGRCITSFPTGGISHPVSMSQNSRFSFCGDIIWDIMEKKPLRKLDYSTHAAWSPDGSVLITSGRENTINLWMIDWELEAMPRCEWSEEIMVYLENFVKTHIPYKEELKSENITEEDIKNYLKREGTPCWNENDLNKLFSTLQYSGYGNLKKESIIEKLELLKKEGIKKSLKDKIVLFQENRKFSHEEIKSVLDNITDINITDNHGNTPLHRIVTTSSGNRETLKLLIDRGADLLKKNHSSGLSPIELAGKRRFFTPVLEEIVIEKIYEKANLSSSGAIEEFSISPVHFMTIKNQEEELKTIIKGSNVNSKDILGNTPLHYGAINGNEKIAALLLENGATIKEKNIFERTPLHYGAGKGHRKIIELLLENDSDINIKDPADWTPLHFAAKSNSLNAVEVLLKKGAKTDIMNSDYDTPLETAICFASEEIIKILSDGFEDKENCTVLNLAVENGRKDIIELLLNKGFNINGTSTLNQTPLHIAATEGNMDIAKLLLNRGADIDLIWYKITSMTISRLEHMGWHLFNGRNLGKLSQKVDRAKLNFIKTSKLMNKVHRGQKITDYLTSGVVIIREQDVTHLIKKIWSGHLNIIKEYFDKNIFQREFFNKMLSMGYGDLYFDITQKGRKVIDYSTGDLTRIKSDTNEKIPFERRKTLNQFIDREMSRTIIKEKLKEAGFKEDEIKVILGQAKLINKADRTGKAPLHYAVEKGHKDIVKLFIEKGADVNIKANNKKTPFQLTDDEDMKNLLLRGYKKSEQGGGLFSLFGKLFGK